MPITIRRHQHGITLNPYEYMLNENQDPINFESRKDALQYLDKKGLEIRGEDGKLKEELLWDTYGVELHEVDMAQLAQLSHEIKKSDEQE